MEKMIIYHGSSQIVEMPEIRITKYNKDFYFGFYCTVMEKQARRWQQDLEKQDISAFMNIRQIRS